MPLFNDPKTLAGLSPWEMSADNIPEFQNPIFFDLKGRAWSYLAGRSAEDMHAAYEVLTNWIEEIYAQWPTDQSPPARWGNYTHFLRQAMRHHDQEVNAYWDWPEYFVLLALDIMAEARWNEFLSYQNVVDETVLADGMIVALCDATEAVATADILFQQFNVDADRTVRTRNQLAAMKRHEPLRKLKWQLRNFYKQGEFETIDAACRAYYETLSEDEKRLLNNEESGWTRELTEYLGKTK